MIATATGGQTLQQFAESLMPGWRFPEDWLTWPPDTFALTSALLGRTGAYRRVIEAEASHDARWQPRAEAAAEAWTNRVSRALCVQRPRKKAPSDAGGAILDEIVAAVDELARTVTLERLRTLAESDDEAAKFAEELLKLHAVADEACTGFGVLGPMRPESALAHCLANLLLTAKGSLSRIPKHAGVVLPKLRTPQQGLTLRSLSHHVTFHVSEVEVMWRAMPWPNVEENTINILTVPWPQEVDTLNFHPLEDKFQPVRYFSYRPEQKPNAALQIARISELVAKIEAEHCRVHLVVFPESALSVSEYLGLLGALKEARQKVSREGGKDGIQRVPMVIAGVHRRENGQDFNEVRLAAYFAERWYELSQRKHHRWRLDRNQIRQYGLEGRLATARGWYENITLGQRRLTFFAPNGWLALSPLICEDLAQLEPVSELIRGVGPTLLVSLLADGPQIPQRWSARYASVFADDPGTAVLTLSSLGMVSKAKRLEPGAADEPSRTFALWKDHVTGWQSIDLPEGCEAVLMTISADFREEFTADSRGDHQSAATFKYEGKRGFKLPEVTEEKENTAQAQAGIVADWGDMRELSAATFAINTLLHLRRADDVKVVLGWLLADPKTEKRRLGDSGLESLIAQVFEAQRDPRAAGILPGPQTAWPTESLVHAAKAIHEFFADQPDRDANFWRTTIAVAIERLERVTHDGRASEDPSSRVDRVIPYAVLTCIHGLLERLRRRQTRKHGGSSSTVAKPTQMTTAEAAALFEQVEAALAKYSY